MIDVEFSKHAKQYEDNNTIQNLVIDKLLSLHTKKPKYILDLGCGSGALCKKIKWDYKNFIGVDFAKGMLELHPKSKKITPIYGNFNDNELFEHLKTYKLEHIYSASALQWAENLENTFHNLQQLNTPLSLAIFSAGTFETLNKTASLKPLLKTAQEIEKLQKIYFKNAHFELQHYTLTFPSTREIFKYIKQSGVSGARKVLSFKQTKKLMQEYPLQYLEFEVVFIVSN